MKNSVALCTLEVDAVPHEPFPERFILAVEEAIQTAWELLHKRVPRADLVDAMEPVITNHLRNLLEELRCKEPPPLAFNEADFGPVIMGGEVENYSGIKVGKEPDLTFYCRDRRTGIRLTIYDAIFGECKWIGNGRSVDKYASEGIERFVCGDYAWAMTHALMVGYAYGRSVLPRTLSQYMTPDTVTLYKVIHSPVIQKCALSNNVYETFHERTWHHRNGSAPGPIKLRHLWLRFPKPTPAR